jgi:hypothetical protein
VPEIGDAALRRRLGVNREQRPSREPLISADGAEFVPTRKCLALGDLDLDQIAHATPLPAKEWF